MKTAVLISLALLLAPPLLAATNRIECTLTGIVALGDAKRAAFKVRSPKPAVPVEFPVLGEAERWVGFEVARIDPERATVEIREDNTVRTLTIPGKPAGSRTAGHDTKPRASLLFQDAPLWQVLTIYGELTERTILQHPQLRLSHCSLEFQAEDPTQAVVGFGDRLRKTGLALIPDGTRFLLVVPAALTNTARPRSDRPTTSSRPDATAPGVEPLIPKGVIRLYDTPMAQVLDIYGEMVGRKARNRDHVTGGGIYLQSNTPLSRPELLYAFDTLLAWNGLRILFHDDGQTFTAEHSSPGQPDDRE